MNKKIEGKLLTIISATLFGVLVVISVFWYGFNNGSEDNVELASGEGESASMADEYNQNKDDGELTTEEFLGGFGEEADYGNNSGELVDKPELWYSMSPSAELEKLGINTSSSVNGQYQRLINTINSKAVENSPSSQMEENETDPLTEALNDAFKDLGNEQPEAPSILTGGNNTNNTNQSTNQPVESGSSDGTEQTSDVNTPSLTIGTEVSDANGVASKSNGSKFDIYNYVEKDTVIIKGGSLQSKVFNELNKLNTKFVVILDDTVKVEKVIKWITDDYNNKLLIDKLNYGRASESDSNHYIFEIDYLVSNKQLEELRDFAISVSDIARDKKDKKQIEYIAERISSLGSYSENGANIYSPYSLYKDGYGVCQAYTSLAKIILDNMGIENGIATGSLDGIPHTWNVAEYNGELYHFDFTLTDTKSNPSKYLFIKGSDITDDRTVDSIIK